MPKNAVTDWSTTAALNTDVGGINIDENCPARNINDAIREVMEQIAAAHTAYTWTLLDDADAATARTTLGMSANGSSLVSAADYAAMRALLDLEAGTDFYSVSGADAAFQPLDADTAKLDVADQVITGGARVTSLSLGTITTGTVTLDPGDRPLQHYTNNGAHTLAPGTNAGTIILDITNGASAGAVTTSGWTKVVGAFTTTNAHKFRCSCSVGDGGSLLVIQALQ